MAIDARQLLDLETGKAAVPGFGLTVLVAAFSFASCTPPECLDCSLQPCGTTSSVPTQFFTPSERLPSDEVLSECDSTISGLREDYRCDGEQPLAITRSEDGEIQSFARGDPPTWIVSYGVASTGEYTIDEYINDPDSIRLRYMQFDSFFREVLRLERVEFDMRIVNRSIRFHYLNQSESKQLDFIESTTFSGENEQSSRRLIREIDGLNFELVDFGPNGEIDEVKRLEPCCPEEC